MAYYAWSNFPIERNEWGQTTKTVTVGESVTADKLGVSKEEFDELVELGAVREEEYPDIPDNVAPAEAQAAQTAHETAVQELTLAVEETAPEEAPKAAQAKAASAGKE